MHHKEEVTTDKTPEELPPPPPFWKGSLKEKRGSLFLIRNSWVAAAREQSLLPSLLDGAHKPTQHAMSRTTHWLQGHMLGQTVHAKSGTTSWVWSHIQVQNWCTRSGTSCWVRPCMPTPGPHAGSNPEWWFQGSGIVPDQSPCAWSGVMGQLWSHIPGWNPCVKSRAVCPAGLRTRLVHGVDLMHETVLSNWGAIQGSRNLVAGEWWQD